MDSKNDKKQRKREKQHATYTNTSVRGYELENHNNEEKMVYNHTKTLNFCSSQCDVFHLRMRLRTRIIILNSFVVYYNKKESTLIRVIFLMEIWSTISIFNHILYIFHNQTTFIDVFFLLKISGYSNR
jgi:hypothetical protein